MKYCEKHYEILRYKSKKMCARAYVKHFARLMKKIKEDLTRESIHVHGLEVSVLLRC